MRRFLPFYCAPTSENSDTTPRSVVGRTRGDARRQLHVMSVAVRYQRTSDEAPRRRSAFGES